MTLHMTATGVGALCGTPKPTVRVTLEMLVRFHPLTFWLMRIFGCRYCAVELRDALRHARPIR
jgi:hypothetical protein